MVKWSRLSEDPASWLHVMSSRVTKEECALLEKAFRYVQENQRDFLERGLMIADFLFELDVDAECIAAALLFPLHQRMPLSMEEVDTHFRHSIWRLLQDGLNMRNISSLGNQHQWSSHQVEKVRGMLLAMVKDPRAVLMVLAERVLDLRFAKTASIEEQKRLASETLDVYAPLANRLGVFGIKWEMEDLCLRYKDPEMYKTIAKQLDEKRSERETALLEIKTELSELLTHAGILNFSLQGRIKHIYSIYKKMQRKDSDFSKIYDICALRVLTQSVDECYQVLSVLQEKYAMIPEEFDDYIAQPKANGYQSIHMVCVTEKKRVVEIQIRTEKMHHEGELGAASHWSYKEGGKPKAHNQDKIALLRQVMAWQKELAGSDARASFPDMFEDRVYVFTPLGDIIDLPPHSTPLDFAYHIHSEVGHRTRGAKVNGKMVPLTHTLETGNVVEILTNKFPHPSRDWLSPHMHYLHSPRARSILAHWFRVKDEENSEKQEAAHPEKQSSARASEKRFVTDHLELSKEKPALPLVDVNHLLMTLAKCCKPLPGDDILAFVTRMRGISVHKKECSNIRHLLSQFPQKFLPTHWSSIQASSYRVDLKVKFDLNKKDMLKNIMGAMVDADLDVISIRNERENNLVGLALLTVAISDAKLLNKAVSILKQLDGVVSVER